ncbi:expressed unknown protein [Seminavis robusta]|uniref:Uncharacterized protein n=1 Tax=Seminavis robusta TaxID=568900 RepID=A0A9N8DI47_9STRA|nr:expressed unknown protein [Seminavis robusta]|eukprot:Sro170_g075410.1 n/a (425) ;mRNA; f:46134-47408
MKIHKAMASLLLLAAYAFYSLGGGQVSKDAEEQQKGRVRQAASRAGKQQIIQSRAFERKPLDQFPCVLQSPHAQWWMPPKQGADKPKEGFFFLKTEKTASSTSAGVHLRIAHNMAARKVGKSSPPIATPMCLVQFSHSNALQMGYAERIKKKSFLWTVVREPSQRMISHFFHFGVTRLNWEPTARNFKRWLLEPNNMADNYYLRKLRVTKPNISVQNSTQEQHQHQQQQQSESSHHNEILVADTLVAQSWQALIDEYDFIAVTERMEESIVALQMILGLSTADVMYLSAKENGGYEGGGWNNTCLRIHRRNVTPGMEAFLGSPLWESYVKWDRLFYEAVNQSLDKTIQALGRKAFERNLQRFKQAQDVAHKQCRGKVRFPCSTARDGLPPLRMGESDCLWNDSACGMSCIDDVANQLGLWEAIS